MRSQLSGSMKRTGAKSNKMEFFLLYSATPLKVCVWIPALTWFVHGNADDEICFHMMCYFTPILLTD